MALLASEKALKEETPEIWKVVALEVGSCQSTRELSIPAAAEVTYGPVMHVTGHQEHLLHPLNPVNATVLRVAAFLTTLQPL